MLRRTRKLAIRSGVRGLKWGCVIRPWISDAGKQAFLLTTLGGERMLLTVEMLRAVHRHVFHLQGRTLATLMVASRDVGRELVTAIDVECCHVPSCGSESRDLALLTHSRYAWMCMQRPMVLLTRARPPGWPR